jgi:signal transduction histidine kinase
VLGRTDAEVMPSADAARRVMANDRRVFANCEPIESEEAVPLADGSMRHWLTRKLPLRDENGRLVGLLGIARDVTGRKLAESQRDATRLMLEMGIQAAGLVLADIDYRTDLNHISAELARLLELGEGATTVPRKAIFDRIHPDDRERYLQAIARTTDPEGSGHLAIDVRALLPSGGVRWLHIRLQVIFSMIDGVMRADRGICAARDVTVETLALQQLHDADRRKDEFIAMLAHELRNPLAPVRTGLEILKRVGELPPVAARTRDMMERQLTHMVRLIDDLLDVSRITRGKLELRPQALSMAQVVEHAVEACQPAVEAAGHSLEVVLPPEPLMLPGDLTRLAQVLGNLIHNAAKYTPRGGRIQVRAARAGDDAVLEVIDNGAGIEPAALPELFELFVQAGQGELAGRGLGIGLWLVRRLVQLHGGTIEAFSEGPGRGSTFRVRLPLQRG